MPQDTNNAKTEKLILVRLSNGAIACVKESEVTSTIAADSARDQDQ